MHSLTVTDPKEEFSREQVDLIKRTVCKGATDLELQLFLNHAKRTRLDPFTRQIFAVKRWDAKEGREILQPQTSVDGLRLIAERTGLYEGQVGPEWCGDDGVWKDIWLSEKPPSAARVGVWKKGFREILWGKVTFNEFCARTKDGKPNRMWQTMGPTMLAKCAESIALRRAFPHETSGVYTAEEMEQSENVPQERLRPMESAVPTTFFTPEKDTFLTPINTVDLNARLNGLPKAPTPTPAPMAMPIPAKPFTTEDSEVFNTTETPGEFLIPFGSMSGRRLKDFQKAELAAYLEKTKSRAPMAPDNMKDIVNKTIVKIEEYLKG